MSTFSLVVVSQFVELCAVRERTGAHTSLSLAIGPCVTFLVWHCILQINTHAHYFLATMSSEFQNERVNFFGFGIGTLAIENDIAAAVVIAAVVEPSTSIDKAHTHTNMGTRKETTNWKNCIELTTHSVLCALGDTLL